MNPPGRPVASTLWPLLRPRAADCRWLLFLLSCLIPCPADAAQPIHYLVDLSASETHLVQVTFHIPEASAGTEIQFPTWNCLYQIRDFVKSVEDLKGDCDGQPAGLDRESFVEIVTAYRRELWFWLIGDRPWGHFVEGLAGRVGRRVPAS